MGQVAFEPAPDPGDMIQIIRLPVAPVEPREDAEDFRTALRREHGEVSVPVAARVEMMCGCPLTPDGHWDSDEFEITARLLRDGLPVTGAVLGYAGAASEFEGSPVISEPGRYEVLVRAHQPRTGNSGVARGTFVVD